MARNEFGQPIGEPVPDWTRCTPPGPVVLHGRTVRLEPLTAEHARDLHRALVAESAPRLWTYLYSGPFVDRATFEDYLESVIANPQMCALAVLVDGVALGHECLMRADPGSGSVEVGNIVLADALQRTTAATEAAYLLARHVFDTLGYRRYEWKCDSLNEASRRAAQRLGFTYEGTFRQAVVYKGRNRDTAWFSITDTEWPARRARLEAWLDPGNFGADGAQLHRLGTGVGSAP